MRIKSEEGYQVKVQPLVDSVKSPLDLCRLFPAVISYDLFLVKYKRKKEGLVTM